MSGTTPPRPGTARRRLSPPLIAFIVFDALLVLAAVWLAVSLATGSGEPSAEQTPAASAPVPAPSAEPTTPAPAPEEEPTEDPTEDTGGQQVVSPSGNIACDVSPQGARCAIAELAEAPAPVEGCEGSVGYVVEVTLAGVDTPCVEGDEPLVAGDGASVLEYGQEIAVETFVCVSSEAGMTCTDSGTGQGFTLARAGVTVVG